MYEDDAVGGRGSARDRWFTRTLDDIDQERRDAEQAGRDAYAEAIRTSQDVQARTPDELIQLGRLARQGGGQAAPGYAQPGGGMQRLGDDQPLINSDDNYQVAGPAASRPFPNAWDPIIEREVAKYNKMNQADPGDDVYLDPDLVRAMIRVESGHDMKAYNSDPMQVNKSTGDWDGYKGEIGLTKGVPPGPELGIRAGLAWLDSKSYHANTAGQLGPFRGYQAAVTDYNSHSGSGNPHYWDDVQRAYRDIKSGRR